MKTACPNCGGEVEFRYDDSFVRVCPFCRASVLRTDRGVETLGQFADLVPFDSTLALFAGGVLGHESFLLVGMAQLRQGTGGVSQEWYAKFDGRWGWLAEGQGRYYLTFEVPDAQQLPRFEELVPGEQMRLPHQAMAYTVGERGQATYMSATGELPFRLPAGQTYRFVDLSDGAGAFATIDYGDGSEPPTLYEGRQVTLAELQITGGEVAPAAKPISSTKITCPSCGAPVDLRTPGQSLRVACAYCSALIDLESTGKFTKLNLKATPSIPLGSTGTFADGEMTVIGYLSRSANVDGSWYSFEEYLLHAPAIGFRWLVNSDGHWSYVQPIAPGAVEYAGSGAKYDGVKFKLFQGATNLRVDTVLGEMYWRVTAGEIVTGEDFIAPPAMLSREATGNEENWSLSSYMTVKQVQQAFGNKDLPLGTPIGVGANQQYGIHGFSFVSSIAFIALIVVAIVAATMAKGKVHYSHTLTVPKTAAAAAGTPAAVVDPCTELDALLTKVEACDAINYTDKSMFRLNVDMAKTMTTSLPSDKSCATMRDEMTTALHACDVKKEPVNVPVDAPPVADPCADFATYASSLAACPKFTAASKTSLKRSVDRLKPKTAGKPTTGEKAACKGALDAAHGAAKKAGCKVDEPAPPPVHDTCADYDAAMKQLLACDKVAPNARDALRLTLESAVPKPDAPDRVKACADAMTRINDIASGTGCALGDKPADPCANAKIYAPQVAACTTIPANTRDALAHQLTRAATVTDVASACRELEAMQKSVASASKCSALTLTPATPVDASAEPPGSTFFSDPFELSGAENIEVDVSAPGLNNDWVYFAADLVEDKTGQVVTFDDNIEYYSGVDDGESWDEGSKSTDQVIPPVHGGTYVLRLESQHGAASDQLLEVTVKQGIFRWRYFWLAMLVLGLPYFIFGLHEWSFEKHRWDNSSVGRSGAPKTFASIVLTMFGGVFIVIWAIISSMGSSDD